MNSINRINRTLLFKVLSSQRGRGTTPIRALFGSALVFQIGTLLLAICFLQSSLSPKEFGAAAVDVSHHKINATRSFTKVFPAISLPPRILSDIQEQKSYIFSKPFSVNPFPIAFESTRPFPSKSDLVANEIEEKIKSVRKLNRQPILKRAAEVSTASTFDRQSILNDNLNRISNDFKIPSSLKRRVGFWFDIYTKYGEHQHVIHHIDYPWIVFDVVDVSDIYKTKRNRWTNYHLANAKVKKRKQEIARSLRALSKKKSFRGLKGLDKKLYRQIRKLKGNTSRNLRYAAKNFRSQLGQKDFFIEGLINSSKYLNFMERHFKKQGLPIELTRIPFVESSFNESAQSKVGASGIWQIMPDSTADGLVYTKYIDERNSPFKATIYAAKHLKRDYRILGDWSLAVTAYNHGVGNLLKARVRHKVSNFSQLLDKNEAKVFGFASQNFFTSVLAAIHAKGYYDFIFEGVTLPAAYEVAKVKLKKDLSVAKISHTLNISIQEFFRLNIDTKKAILARKTLPKGFVILIPRKAESLVKNSLFKLFSDPIRLSYQKAKARPWQIRGSL